MLVLLISMTWTPRKGRGRSDLGIIAHILAEVEGGSALEIPRVDFCAVQDQASPVTRNPKTSA